MANPTSLNLTRLRNSVNENANSATALNIARFTLNDPDGGANVVSLSGAHASFFDLSQSNGTYTLFLKPDVGFNFETTPTLDLFINSYTAGTDPAQALSVKYDLRVLNVNEAPIIGSDGAGATARLVANTNSLFVTDIDATDPDAGDSVTYSVSGGPNRDLFNIDTNGVLSFKSLPQEGQYSVLVRATDRAGLSDSQLLTINTVVSPEITSLGGANQASVKVDENSTVVTTVQATDPNGRALSYSLKGGADASLFNIDATTGVLSFKNAPNFEAPTDQGANNIYDVVVRATNSLGGVDEQQVAVRVLNVNESPANARAVNGLVSEDQQATNVTDFGGVDLGRKVLFHTDGSFTVAGVRRASSDSIALARYTAQGELDTRFGDGSGKVLQNFGGFQNDLWDFALDSAGRIVTAGNNLLGGGSFNFSVVRFNSDGSLDTSFGAGTGRVTTDLKGNEDTARAVALDSQGRIVAAGYALAPVSAYDFAATRYLVDGTIDTTFAAGTGKAYADFNLAFYDVGNGVDIDAQGRIVMTGVTGPLSAFDIGLVRFTSEGLLDASFGSGGRVVTDLGGTQDFGWDVRHDPQGRILVAGYTTAGGGGQNFVVARYTSNGQLDTSFGDMGRVITDFAASTDEGRGLAFDELGRLLVSGYASTPSGGQNFAIARYHSNGVLDTSFGGGSGKVVTDFQGGADQGFDVAASNGRIVVSGTSNGNFAIAIYNGNGMLVSDQDNLLKAYATLEITNPVMGDAPQVVRITANPSNALGGSLTLDTVSPLGGVPALGGVLGFSYLVDNTTTQALGFGDAVTEHFTVTVSGATGTADYELEVKVLGAHETVSGGALADQLIGTAFADYIRGGAGFDDVTGGAGADVFAFRAGDGNFDFMPDEILDFEVGVDKISLGSNRSTNHGAFIQQFSNETNFLNLFTTAEGQSVLPFLLATYYVPGSAYFFHDANGNGRVELAGPDLFVRLTGVTSFLSPSDFQSPL